jgi:hypothetical protein
MREGDVEVRKIAAHYASIELMLIKTLGKEHCKSVLDRYLDYMEVKPAQ